MKKTLLLSLFLHLSLLFFLLHEGLVNLSQISSTFVSSSQIPIEFIEKTSGKKNSLASKTLKKMELRESKGFIEDASPMESSLSGTSDPYAPSGKAKEVQALTRFEEELIKYILENKEYPLLSRKNGQEGQVYVGFRISKGGEITNIRLIKECPFKRLNDAALELFKRALAFKKVPEELSLLETERSYLIDYRLN